MAKQLSPEEFYNKIHITSGTSSPEVIQRVYEAMIHLVIEELKLHGEVSLPYFQNLTLSQCGDTYGQVGNQSNQYIPPYFRVRPRFNEHFKAVINDKEISRHERRLEREERKLNDEAEAIGIRKDFRRRRGLDKLDRIIEEKRSGSDK